MLPGEREEEELSEALPDPVRSAVQVSPKKEETTEPREVPAQTREEALLSQEPVT